MIAPSTLANGAAVMSGMVAATGAAGILQPQMLLNVLEFPGGSTTQDQKTVIGLTRLLAARDLAMAAPGLAIWYYGRNGTIGDSNKLLGIVMLLGSVVTTTDGFVSKAVIGRKELFHWGFTPVLVGLGVGLLGWI